MSHYDKYRKVACEWCRAEKPFYPPWQDMSGEYKDHHVKDQTSETSTLIECEALTIEQWVEQVAANLEQVDDVLIVDWITVKDNDYKKALADLVTMNIAQHDDPALNPPITGVAMRHRETKAIFSIPKPARHDTLIRELVRLGEPEFAKGEQGFITEDGQFLDREQAFKHAVRFGQLTGKILFSEDLW